MHVGPRDPAQFVAPDWGRAVTTIGPAPYVAFVPTPLPRTMSLDTATISALSHADSSLGRLAGTGQLMSNPHLLLIPFARREALSSSRIEGTQASLSDVFEAEAGGRPTEDVREVTNYTAAMDHGLARLDTLPVSSRLLCEMHAHLLRGMRGQERTPGELRRSQNWIGTAGASLQTAAVFVPPPVDDMVAALSDWERYAHDPSPVMPLLVRAALLHYQFETIHPFLDGNGRLGRLFIVLFLVEHGALPFAVAPLVSVLRTSPGQLLPALAAGS